ncbi:MAG: c-type cytochrome biogenesis protein CcmI [Rhizobiaceae bacterium]|nr:c-type cytochrome biogenesis protein CcmI [Rhizobiaceae bacterium]
MVFWIAITSILTLTVFAVWRSWVAKLGGAVTAEESDLAIYQSRLNEIERDLAAGRLDGEMAEAAKAEEARKLLKTQNESLSSHVAPTTPSGWWMTLGLFSIPLISVLLYLSLGTPPSELARFEQPEVAGQSMGQLIAAAERRLENNPDDLEGWQVLAPVYMRQQDFGKAENAFRNIIRISGESTEVLSAFGEVLVAKAGGQVTPEALKVFERSIALNSANSNARFFVGLAALQRNDTSAAKLIWQAMIDDADGDEEWLPVMKQRIAQLDGAPSGDAAREIANLPQEEQQELIRSMVDGLAARLQEQPEDKTGWIRLVRAYMVLQRKEDAEKAAASAIDTFPNDQEFSDQIESALKQSEGVSN